MINNVNTPVKTVTAFNLSKTAYPQKLPVRLPYEPDYFDIGLSSRFLLMIQNTGEERNCFDMVDCGFSEMRGGNGIYIK